MASGREPAPLPLATSLGSGAQLPANADTRRWRRPNDDHDDGLTLDCEQLERQDESNKLLDEQLAAVARLNGGAECKSNLADAGLEGDEADEKAHFLKANLSAPAANCAPNPQVDHLKRRHESTKQTNSPFKNHNNNNNDTNNNNSFNKSLPKGAHLAKQESIFEHEDQKAAEAAAQKQPAYRKKLSASSSSSKAARKKKREAAGGEEEEEEAGGCCNKMFAYLLTPLLLLIYSAAIYCLPFVQIQPATVAPLPVIPFNFHEGPLKPSSASAFKIQHLFRGQLHGPESLALDSQANLYMAIEGGFILFAHLNQSSPIRRVYLESALGQATAQLAVQEFQRMGTAPSVFADSPELIKIAELNGAKPTLGARRPQRDNSGQSTESAMVAPSWKRDCQLDEQIYGQQLASLVKEDPDRDGAKRRYHFKSNVRVSRCSKPLGLRLTPDESTLYVVDTLTGLFRINLRQPAQQRSQVTKLIDFAVSHVVPVVQMTPLSEGGEQTTRQMNVSLRAIDDLAIDFGAGSRGGDLIYLTVASQSWPATSFVFDHLEGRPSGLVLRFDANASERQLVVLEPARLAHVRNSNLIIEAKNESNYALSRRAADGALLYQPSVTLGAPRLDENDLFDDRPLNFPNGLELMDDRQALLIADTSNKRIIKHWIRGPRRGTSDLWAWTPQYPDNIRRGFDRNIETYWVVGCGRGPKVSSASSSSDGNQELQQQQKQKHQSAGQMFERNFKLNSDNWDMFKMLHNWPRVRKFALKNIYFAGALVEFMGAHVLRSTKVQDFGYELKTGSSMCANGCMGMMVLQYNQQGDIIKSIHSREFPNDLFYYSQANELIDGQAAEHVLFLGSPSYNYVTKLILPTETRPLDA